MPLSPDSKPANNRDLTRVVAASAGITQADAKTIIDHVLMGIVKLCDDRQALKLRDFGRFEIRRFSPRRNTSSLTGGTVMLPGRDILCFTAAKGLKEEVIE